MTCTHQWHDATTAAGPEWVCSQCKVKYSDTKQVTRGKRHELMELMKDLPADETWIDAFMRRLKEKEPLIYDYMILKAREAKLKEKNEM